MYLIMYVIASRIRRDQYQITCLQIMTFGTDPRTYLIEKGSRCGNIDLVVKKAQMYECTLREICRYVVCM
jgi:hypothetical protein